jgi:hypothetical protein
VAKVAEEKFNEDFVAASKAEFEFITATIKTAATLEPTVGEEAAICCGKEDSSSSLAADKFRMLKVLYAFSCGGFPFRYFSKHVIIGQKLEEIDKRWETFFCYSPNRI